MPPHLNLAGAVLHGHHFAPSIGATSRDAASTRRPSGDPFVVCPPRLSTATSGTPPCNPRPPTRFSAPCVPVHCEEEEELETYLFVWAPLFNPSQHLLCD